MNLKNINTILMYYINVRGEVLPTPSGTMTAVQRLPEYYVPRLESVIKMQFSYFSTAMYVVGT